jgi:cell division septation protein DedD
VLQVLVLAAVLIGLSRLAGRSGKPARGDGESALQAETIPPAPQADEMSGVVPDLTFYRSLGKERPAPAEAGSGTSAPRADAAERPLETAPAAGAFVVQALATRDGAVARRLRDRLAGRGFPATLTEDPSGGKIVYRVRVGRYRLRSEAEAAARVLRQRDHLRPWILQGGE